MTGTGERERVQQWHVLENEGETGNECECSVWACACFPLSEIDRYCRFTNEEKMMPAENSMCVCVTDGHRATFCGVCLHHFGVPAGAEPRRKSRYSQKTHPNLFFGPGFLPTAVSRHRLA